MSGCQHITHRQFTNLPECLLKEVSAPRQDTSTPPCASHKWKYCILQLGNWLGECFLPHPWIISTHVSLDILHLLPWPSFPLLALHVTHRSSAPHPHVPQSPLLEGQLPPLSLFQYQKEFLISSLGWLLTHLQSLPESSFQTSPKQSVFFSPIALLCYFHALCNGHTAESYLTVLALFSFIIKCSPSIVLKAEKHFNRKTNSQGAAGFTEH